jgi:rubrerythrin
MTPTTRQPSVDELMQQAMAMEREAEARYTELADIMEQHNNPEVAELFRKMALYEGGHVHQLAADMGVSDDVVEPREAGVWVTAETPETVPMDEIHYLMHPWHALSLALAAEERAVAFFDRMIEQTDNEAFRATATEMRDEEIEHVALVRAWMERVPPPDDVVDPDPPRLGE